MVRRVRCALVASWCGSLMVVTGSFSCPLAPRLPSETRVPPVQPQPGPRLPGVWISCVARTGSTFRCPRGLALSSGGRFPAVPWPLGAGGLLPVSAVLAEHHSQRLHFTNAELMSTLDSLVYKYIKSILFLARGEESLFSDVTDILLTSTVVRDLGELGTSCRQAPDMLLAQCPGVCDKWVP